MTAMHSCYRRRTQPPEEKRAEKALAEQKRIEEDKANKRKAQEEEDKSQRSWIMQYMEQDASEDDSSQVSPQPCYCIICSE